MDIKEEDIVRVEDDYGKNLVYLNMKKHHISNWMITKLQKVSNHIL